MNSPALSADPNRSHPYLEVVFNPNPQRALSIARQLGLDVTGVRARFSRLPRGAMIPRDKPVAAVEHARGVLWEARLKELDRG
jgi:hypothetical protein